jgi:hypothetical protein
MQDFLKLFFKMSDKMCTIITIMLKSKLNLKYLLSGQKYFFQIINVNR